MDTQTFLSNVLHRRDYIMGAAFFRIVPMSASLIGKTALFGRESATFRGCGVEEGRE